MPVSISTKAGTGQGIEIIEPAILGHPAQQPDQVFEHPLAALRQPKRRTGAHRHDPRRHRQIDKTKIFEDADGKSPPQPWLVMP